MVPNVNEDMTPGSDDRRRMGLHGVVAGDEMKGSDRGRTAQRHDREGQHSAEHERSQVVGPMCSNLKIAPNSACLHAQCLHGPESD